LDIGAHHLNLTISCLREDFSLRRSQIIFAPGDQYQLRSGRRKGQAHGLAQSKAAARYQGRAAIQS
jgi:hypothetical protein